MANIVRRKRNADLTSPAFKAPKNADLIVADISGSMAESTGQKDESGKLLSRWDCLCLALAPFVGRANVIAFSDEITEVPADAIPHVQGGTQMDKALYRAEQLDPLHVLVISDGHPDNRERTKVAAQLLAAKCIIDALYIGPANERNEEFMKELARIGRGSFSRFDLTTHTTAQLESKVGSMLSLPAPKSINL